jgi:glycosyltransferase involved in cell wall biosynthesis
MSSLNIHLPKRKILFIIGTLSRGGAERHLCELIKELGLLSFQPQVFILNKSGPLVSEIDESKVKIHFPPNSAILSSLPSFLKSLFLAISAIYRLIAVFSKERPDAVHMFLPASYILGSMVGLFFPKSIRIMSRRSLNNYQNKNVFLKCFERWLHKFTPYIFANSSEVKKNLIEEGVESHKIILIPNGVKKFDSSLENKIKIRRSLGLEDNCFIFVKVANLIGYKGHMELIKALKIFSNSANTSFKLLLVGKDGGEKLKQEQLAKKLGVFKNIIWLGEQSSPREFIAIADVALIVSHEEGMSNALLEKMSAALPVIATNVGGNKDLIHDGENGLLVSSKSPIEISNAMFLYYRDEVLRAKLGQSARRTAQIRFGFDNMIRLYLEAYNKILD